jgi:4-amino-4-deoxychorismate lyase
MSGERLSLVNGQPVTEININDRDFNFGDGLFETIAVRDGQALLWAAHVRRLIEGARRLGIALPSETVLAREVQLLCGNAARAVLKIIIARGVRGQDKAPDGAAGPTRVLRRLPASDYPARYWRDGVCVRVCQRRLARDPQLAGIKHLCRLPQTMARAEWQDEFAEGLMLDDSGAVIEGTKSNLFIVANGKLQTPELSGAGVWGVARAWMMERAAATGLQVSVESISLEAVYAADEIFITNSLIGLWPVRELEGKAYSVGPVTKTLQATLADAFPVPRDL